MREVCGLWSECLVFRFHPLTTDYWIPFPFPQPSTLHPQLTAHAPRLTPGRKVLPDTVWTIVTIGVSILCAFPTSVNRVRRCPSSALRSATPLPRGGRHSGLRSRERRMARPVRVHRGMHSSANSRLTSHVSRLGADRKVLPDMDPADVTIGVSMVTVCHT